MEEEVPDGAAVFPVIPGELGVDPLFLALLHAIVFVAGSDEPIVHPAAADEALGYIADYLGRLTAARRREILQEIRVLVAFANEEKWPKQLVATLKAIPGDFGISEEAEG